MLEVVVATYNGQRFLKDFLASLDRQTRAPDLVTFRDDGSTDGTVALILEYCRRNPHASLLQDDAGNVGVIGNFGRLLMQSRAAWVMPADQDDVWHDDKIERSLDALIAIEAAQGGDCPALVFCDLEVTDADLRVLHPSFIAHQSLRALIPADFRRLLTQNVAPGCAMAFNRALLQLAMPIPAEACMHDWWLILVAALHGRVEHLPMPLIAYRQHGDNAVGAKPGGVGAALRDGGRAIGAHRLRLQRARAQAGALLQRHGASMTADQRAEAQALSVRAGWLQRRVVAARAGLSKAGVLRNLAFYLLM